MPHLALGNWDHRACRRPSPRGWGSRSAFPSPPRREGEALTVGVDLRYGSGVADRGGERGRQLVAVVGEIEGYELREPSE